MSFFDKFFSNRNRSNNNESAFTSETESLCFRSSHLSISKSQIRFILFRECDKRGRKLLFDSNSVEKVTLPLKENMCNYKCQQQNEKINDFIEIHKTHAYKYKKPSNDVSSLGEMVFGSVAVIYKGENSCKIHSIPSPKRLMFSTIVNAPFRCRGNAISDLNLSDSRESSLASLSDILNKQLTSSSDSKLYRHEGISQKYSSSYPWIKQTFPFSKVKQCCEIFGLHHSLTKKSFLNESSDLTCLESLCLDKRTRDSSSGKASAEKDHLTPHENSLCLCQKNSDCDGDSSNNYDSSGITSIESDNLSSISGSLSSLKRRWIHSYSTSLDSTTYDETNSSSSRKRTKLGMALILDLSNTLEEEIEKLLFNHTIIIDSAMSKLQACVELAYVKNESFVDLIHTAFLECQQSIYSLITGRKYETPMCCLRDSECSLATQSAGLNPKEKSVGKQESVEEFLVDFCDVLVKFDTKDTNFFITTLLTAVLTHHLSWVTSIAETDSKSPKEKLSVISNTRPYNPIWAQLSDLCGLLGSPLKSAKTVVTGSKHHHLAAIIKIISYFIRCNNVAENIYAVELEEIVGNVESEGKTDFESDMEADVRSKSAAAIAEEQRFDIGAPVAVKAEDYEDEKWKEVSLLGEAEVSKTGSGGLKRTKSYSSHMKIEEVMRPNELYPDIKDLAKRENINVADLNHVENERTILTENFVNSEKFKEKIQKMIRVPKKAVTLPADGFIDLDIGYDTIDAPKTDNFKENRVQMERQRSAPEERRESIVFLLGENEELVNLQKKVVVSKSSFVDMEREDCREFSSDRDGYAVLRGSADNDSENDRSTVGVNNSCGVDDRTFQENSASEKGESFEGFSARSPRVFHEIKMPRSIRPCSTRRLEVSSVMGGVNEQYNSEQIVQGVLEPKIALEQTLQKDLLLCAHNPVLEKNVKEALCILGDMSSWDVSILSSSALGGLSKGKPSGVRVGMSQLVADMLESFQRLHTCSLPPRFCLDHIEKKLREIYLKSKAVAELLTSTELCSIEYLTSKLDIGINDVPLLLSVATTHSPHIAEKNRRPVTEGYLKGRRLLGEAELHKEGNSTLKAPQAVSPASAVCNSCESHTSTMT